MATTAATIQARHFGPGSRSHTIAASATIALEARAKELKAAGHPVISFGAGEPDFGTPSPIKRAALAAMDEDFTHYTSGGGDPALKAAIAKHTGENCGGAVTFEPGQVVATSGAKEALYITFQAICDAGDEVIVPAPFWVSYTEMAKLAGANPVVVDTVPPEWKLTPELLRAHITPRSRLLVLCSPSNPTGILYSDAELAALAEIIVEADMGVVIDEIYAPISYGPVGRWLRAAPHTADRTIVIDGVSKAYAMTGWRLGWLVAPPAIAKVATSVQSHLTSHPSSISQRAAQFALSGDPEVDQSVVEMVATFRERRDAIVELLNTIPGVSCPTPPGAFYVYPDITGLLGRPLGPKGVVCNTDAEVAAYLLNEVYVNTVPGTAFGTPGYLRLSYALGMDDLREGAGRMIEALS